jgi:chromosome segregation ATPase
MAYIVSPIITRLRCIPTEREVRKASRELNSHTSKLDEMQKIEALQKRCADLFAEMKRLERENIKNKKRGDQLQKEKDHSRSELSKNITLREKLEKLCRELQRENNRLKVGVSHSAGGHVE